VESWFVDFISHPCILSTAAFIADGESVTTPKVWSAHTISHTPYSLRCPLYFENKSIVLNKGDWEGKTRHGLEGIKGSKWASYSPRPFKIVHVMSESGRIEKGLEEQDISW
jgi:hypothetical protein